MPLPTIYSVGDVSEATASNQTIDDGNEVENLRVLDNLRSLQAEVIGEAITDYATMFNKQLEKMLTKVKGELSEEQTKAMEKVKMQHLQDVQRLFARRFERIVEEDHVQDKLNEIFDLSSKLSDDTDFLVELAPKTTAAAQEVLKLKDTAEETFESVLKEIQEETSALREDELAAKTLRKSIFKELDHSNRTNPMPKSLLNEEVTPSD